MKLLLLIMSSNKYSDRQNIIRETWLKDYDGEYYFYVGDGKNNIDGDVIRLDCKDTYEDLHMKQGMILNFVLNNLDFDYIFNCDDNTYVIVDRMKNSGFQNYNYMGHPCIIGDVYYAQGAAGYFLSKYAVTKFLETPFSNPIYNFKEMPSDFLVGSILASKNIYLHTNYLFNMGKYINNKGYYAVLPNNKNKYISSHYCDEKTMNLLYSHFHGDDNKIINCYQSRSDKSGLMYTITEDENGDFYIKGNGHPYLELGPFDTAIEAEIAVTKQEENELLPNT